MADTKRRKAWIWFRTIVLCVSLIAPAAMAQAKNQAKGKTSSVRTARASTSKASIHKKSVRSRKAVPAARKRVQRRSSKAVAKRRPANYPRSNARSAAARRPGSSAAGARLSSNTGLPRREVLQLALDAYTCGQAQGLFDSPLLTVIDYSLPSTAERLWVLDVRARKVLFHELVAHGRNSGDEFADAFSNLPGSRQSSLGVFRTEDIYLGRHGESLRLTGLEPGINDLAEERKIVMHGAWYVSQAYASENGQLGRSWGCPALELGIHHNIIDRIRGGSALFVYYPDQRWLRTSSFLHCDARFAQR